MTAFDCYKTYLAFKNHFTKDTFDYFKYGGKTNASVASFNKRKDRYFFEKMSRQRKDDEIVNYFTAIFSQCDDPQRMWIGEIIQTGDEKYKTWQKKVQSLSYVFRQEMENLLSDINFNSIFETENGKHPVLVKEHLRNNLSIESLFILDAIVNYKKEFDGKLNDFVWKTISLKIDKYKPFLLNSIDIDKYKTTLRGIAIQ
jgi:hypothetical protein